MSFMFCTGAIFVKKNSCLVARIVLFDTAGVDLRITYFPYFTAILVQRYWSWYQSRNFTLMTLLKYLPIKSYLNLCFQVSKLLKFDGNIVIT